MQAAADISAILASEKAKKKSKVDPNKLAALALIFNPVLSLLSSCCVSCVHCLFPSPTALIK
jgi:hypothetical protein